MFLVDANVLIYAVNRNAAEHAAAGGWLKDALRGNEGVAFAWTVLLAFVRLSTNPAIFPVPLTIEQATQVVESWLGGRQAVVIEPTGRHLGLLRGLLGEGRTAGNLVSDAHLAALALEYKATVVSFDRDFERFEGIRLVRPDN